MAEFVLRLKSASLFEHQGLKVVFRCLGAEKEYAAWCIQVYVGAVAIVTCPLVWIVIRRNSSLPVWGGVMLILLTHQDFIACSTDVWFIAQRQHMLGLFHCAFGQQTISNLALFSHGVSRSCGWSCSRSSRAMGVQSRQFPLRPQDASRDRAEDLGMACFTV